MQGALAIIFFVASLCGAFQPIRLRKHAALRSTDVDLDSTADQFELFRKNHARGEWCCVKTSYDATGAITDTTLGVTTLVDGGETVDHVVKTAVTEVTSDCEVCADTVDWREFKVGSYTAANLGRQRVNGCGVLTGPSQLRSGSLVTEIAVACGDRRVVLTTQHRPEFDESSQGPTSLQLTRMVVSREVASSSKTFPERGADEAFWSNDPFVVDWPADGLRILAPGSISVQVATEMRPDQPANLRLAWKGEEVITADFEFTALPDKKPPKSAIFNVDQRPV